MTLEFLRQIRTLPVDIFEGMFELVAAEAAIRAAADTTLTNSISAEAVIRAAADAAFALRTTNTNTGDQNGDTFTVTSDSGGTFTALYPKFADEGKFILNQEGEYEPTPGFSGVIENWEDLDSSEPGTLITVGMLPEILTQLGISIP